MKADVTCEMYCLIYVDVKYREIPSLKETVLYIRFYDFTSTKDAVTVAYVNPTNV